MKTTNLISTPNIEGNIGSCEVKTIKNTTGSQVWRTETTVIFTNSCSGEIIKENIYYDYSSFKFMVFVFILITYLLIASIVDSIHSNKY